MKIMRKTVLWVTLLLMVSGANAQTGRTNAPHELPGPLLAMYAKEKPDLGKNGHCAAAFDSRTDGMKMAMSCSIYVRLSAQGERLAVSLCNERAKLLKVKAPCLLIVED